MKKLFLTLLKISMVSLWLFNLLAGIVGAIWLIFTGGWILVVFGLLYGVFMPWAYTIATLPTWLIVILFTKAAEKGKRFITSILGFILSGYNNIILSLWVFFVVSWLVNQYTQYSLIALLLWGYSVAMGPVGYMASKEGPDAGLGTTMGVLFTQIAYLTFTINTILIFFGHNPIIPLWLVILIFTSFLSWMGFISVPSRVEKKLEFDMQPTSHQEND